MAPEDEDAIRWRQEEGALRRGIKNHEDDTDPDWSLAEISRDGDDLAREFYDWWNLNRLDGDTLDVAFTAWAMERWRVPLDRTASGLLKARGRAFQRNRVVAPVIVVSPKRDEEDAWAYVHRLAIENRLMKPDAAPRAPGGWKAAAPHAPAPLLPIPEGYRAPYADPVDVDDDANEDAEPTGDVSPEEPLCETCRGPLGPLDTRFCSDKCAAEIGGTE